MKRNHGVSAAMLALVIVLSVSPFAEAGTRRNFDAPFEWPEKVVRIIKQIQKTLGISTLTDYPNPPKP